MHIWSKFIFVLPLAVTYFYLNVKVNLVEIKLGEGPRDITYKQRFY